MSAEITQWIEDLQSADVATRCDAARELCYAGEEAQAGAVELAVAAADEDDEVREWATGALEELGPPSAADIDRLAELLQRPELDVAYWAATLLGRLAGEAAEAVTALAQALTDHPEVVVRQRAAWALGEIGPPAAGALPALESIASTASDERLEILAREAIDAIRC